MLLQIPSQLHSHTPVYMFTVCCLFLFCFLFFVFFLFLFFFCLFVFCVCVCGVCLLLLFFFCFVFFVLFFQKCVLCFRSWNVLYLATTCTAPEMHIRDWIFLKLERVFMKHYAPNTCLSLKITWKQGCFKYYTNCQSWERKIIQPNEKGNNSIKYSQNFRKN